VVDVIETARRQDGKNEIGRTAMQRTDSYRDLIAWQKAMVLARLVYAVSASWPADERFGLTS
jgi:hypothetical protein